MGSEKQEHEKALTESNELRKANEEIQKANDRLTTEKQTLQNEKEDENQMIQELRQEKETIQMQKEESDRKYQDLRQDKQTMKEEHDKALAKLQDEIKTLKENETIQSSNDEILRAQMEQFKFVHKILSDVMIKEKLVDYYYHTNTTINHHMWFDRIFKKILNNRY